MKFSEMPYKRIDMEEVEKEYKSIIERGGAVWDPPGVL